MENEVIRSRQNKIVKLVASLDRKKSRDDEGMFRFDGIKLYNEAIAKGIEPEYVIICESKLYDVLQKTDMEKTSQRTRVVIVSDDVFFKLSDEKAPEGLITVAKTLDKLHKIATINNSENFFDLPSLSEKVFILESIRDPGNLGTIIRTAASLGIDRLVLSEDCTDIYNPKTIRGAMGALFSLRIDILPVGQTERYISELRISGRRVFAAALHKDAYILGEFEFNSGDVFVIGNEGHGLSDGVIEASDACVLIPMRDGCESLNAAMAAGILMWETLRAGK